MGQLKTIAIAQSSSIHEEVQVGLRAWAKPVVGTSGPGMPGQWSRTGTHIIPHPLLGNEIWSPAGTPRRQNPVGSQGMLMWQYSSSQWSGPDSSTNKRVNPRGASGLLLGTMANFSHCVASCYSEVVGSQGAGTLIDSSTLCLSDGALCAGAGFTGSFLAMSNMSRYSRSPLSSRGLGICGALVLLCRAPLGTFQNWWHTTGGPWPVPPFLHATPFDNPRNFGTPSGEGCPFTPAPPGRAGWSLSHFFPVVQLAPWRPQLVSGPSL